MSQSPWGTHQAVMKNGKQPWQQFKTWESLSTLLTSRYSASTANPPVESNRKTETGNFVPGDDKDRERDKERGGGREGEERRERGRTL